MTEWIIAGTGIIGIIGALVGTLWKFARSIDRVGVATVRMENKMDAQWKKLDDHGETLELHGGRLIALETKTEYIEKAMVGNR